VGMRIGCKEYEVLANPAARKLILECGYLRRRMDFLFETDKTSWIHPALARLIYVKTRRGLHRATMVVEASGRAKPTFLDHHLPFHRKSTTNEDTCTTFEGFTLQFEYTCGSQAQLRLHDPSLLPCLGSRLPWLGVG